MKEKLFLVRAPFVVELFRDEKKARKRWKELIKEHEQNVGVAEGYRYSLISIEDSDIHYALFKWETPSGDEEYRSLSYHGIIVQD